MREISGAELDAVYGGNGTAFCRQLTWWERVKVGYVEAILGEEEARKLARRYSYS